MEAIDRLSMQATEQLQTSYLRVQANSSAARLWERCLTAEERTRLGGNLEVAYRQGSSVGMWMRLHGCSNVRATIEVARTLGFLDDSTTRWLLRETGEFSDDPQEALQLALERADLVILFSPRTIYWMNEEIPIDWMNRRALWNYFVTLCEQAKQGLPVDASDFGEHRSPNDHIKQKSRLSGLKGFPLDLANRIVAGGGGQQVLELKPQGICILELIRRDCVRERC